MHLLNELALKCLTFEFGLLGVTCSVRAVLIIDLVVTALQMWLVRNEIVN